MTGDSFSLLFSGQSDLTLTALSLKPVLVSLCHRVIKSLQGEIEKEMLLLPLPTFWTQIHSQRVSDLVVSPYNTNWPPLLTGEVALCYWPAWSLFYLLQVRLALWVSLYPTFMLELRLGSVL